MPLPGILTIFSAVGSMIGGLSKAKKVVDEITGKDNDIKSDSDLEKAYSELSTAGKQTFVEKMSKEIDMYNAETDRLKNEQGEVTPELQAKVGEDDAGYIAIMRMTTRPWVVRRMCHYVLAPVYLAFFDTLQLIVFSWAGFPQDRAFRAFDYCFGAKNINGVLQVNTLFAEMYMYSIGFVTSIIICYFGLREVGKYKKDESGAIQNIVTSGRGLISKMKNILK